MGIRISSGICAPIALALACGAGPLAAATPAELDALVKATAQPATGIALARRQRGSGDMLDALATLERVIINSPQSNEARLLHAALLCRLDDHRGANVEFDTLRERQIPDRLWEEADAACAQGKGR
jgi:Flp pilus assembly protein TadD